MDVFCITVSAAYAQMLHKLMGCFFPLSEVSFIFQENIKAVYSFHCTVPLGTHGTMKYAYFILFHNCPSKCVKISIFLYWIVSL